MPAGIAPWSKFIKIFIRTIKMKINFRLNLLNGRRYEYKFFKFISLMFRTFLIGVIFSFGNVLSESNFISEGKSFSLSVKLLIESSFSLCSINFFKFFFGVFKLSGIFG